MFGTMAHQPGSGRVVAERVRVRVIDLFAQCGDEDAFVNAPAVTSALQMTHPFSSNASRIESFTSNDSVHSGQRNVYSSLLFIGSS
jgi:hypothetical protein